MNTPGPARRAVGADIEEFVGELKDFATGAYLREEEKHNWMPLIDPSAVDDVAQVLDRGLTALDSAAGDPAAAEQAVACWWDALIDCNRRHDGALIEDDDETRLRQLIRRAGTACGADEDNLEAITFSIDPDDDADAGDDCGLGIDEL
ncbi:hypothetical protein ACFSSC_03675 [Corynebacterium mendelii]|uniref:Uncharacterized protein n=1 Tax=Corynebacterium mendelii TaxID=2765362 RepID=A0A939DZ40_9CORY|nr:hypothetical protein [Corynebacterium mendelii]MBN9643496.1 hypothetical protein [Corynebacterium mendelii]